MFKATYLAMGLDSQFVYERLVYKLWGDRDYLYRGTYVSTNLPYHSTFEPADEKHIQDIWKGRYLN